MDLAWLAAVGLFALLGLSGPVPERSSSGWKAGAALFSGPPHASKWEKPPGDEPRPPSIPDACHGAGTDRSLPTNSQHTPNKDSSEIFCNRDRNDRQRNWPAWDCANVATLALYIWCLQAERANG